MYRTIKHIFLLLSVLCLVGWALPSFSAGKTSAADNTSENAEWIYTFRPYDTIWDVCLRLCNNKNCWQKLTAYNNLQNDRRIPPGTQIRIPLKWLKEQPKAAIVLHAKNANKINNNGKQQALSSGDKIFLREKINTRDQFATVKLANGTVLTISPNSSLRFDEVQFDGDDLLVSAKLYLLKGSVDSNVSKRPKKYFRVSTPSSVAAVRGTRFSVSFDPATDVMRGQVDHGEISVANELGEQIVPLGYAVKVKTGEAPQEPHAREAAPQLAEPLAFNFAVPEAVVAKPSKAASHYTLVVSTTGEAASVIANYSSEKPQWQLQGINPGEYVAHIRVVDEDGFSSLPLQVPFSIYEAELPAIQLSQKGKQLSWPVNRNAEDIQYVLEYSSDESFNDAEQVELDDGQAEYTVSKGAGFWRIRASNAYRSVYSNGIAIQ